MIAVVDYGIGNLRSAEKALQRVGADAALVDDPAAIAAAAAVVLPGVGAFGPCMEALVAAGLDGAVRAAATDGRPFLGICVGMQMLYDGSDESPGVAGLGVLAGTVALLPPMVKRPQMQWNRLDAVGPSSLMGAVEPKSWAYFVHSYAAPAGPDVAATCDYGGPVTAAVVRGPLWATQFHPEKSGRTGLQLLAAFAAGGGVMELYPAIDLRGGRCVRLVQGDFGAETVYGADPVAVARTFLAGGAGWIHVVDLDAARTGDPVNRDVVGRIVGAVTIPVQVGGGVRTRADADALLGLGVTRVVVGTAAVERPEVVAEIAEAWPGRVAVGLDHRDGEVRLRGWTEAGGRRVADLIPEVVAAGAAAVIVTDIARDGELAGPDVVGLAGLLERTGAPLLASGGVATLDDLRLLAAVQSGGRGLVGAVVGKALYEGRFTVAEAVAACGAGTTGGAGTVGP